MTACSKGLFGCRGPGDGREGGGGVSEEGEGWRGVGGSNNGADSLQQGSVLGCQVGKGEEGGSGRDKGEVEALHYLHS